MKKTLIFTAFMCCILALFAKGKRDDIKGTYIEVEGVIQLYGNMPFAYEGLVTDDGKHYSLKGDSDKLKEKLIEFTGRRVKVTGYVALPENNDENAIKPYDMLKDGYLYVEEIEKVKPPKKHKK
ncbi:MAG: hypothetical protein MJ181_06090 [Treponema sp.]|nr:hypothetical protein [Treponema sp.]